MKLTIKSLTGTNFTLDAEPSDTIGSVKAKIEAAQGHAASSQKLIFSGKILTDDQTIEKCNIKSEKDFLVCMVSKPKAPKPEGTAAAVPSTPAPAAASVSTPAAPAPATSAAPPATPATPSPASSAPATAPAAPAAGAATSGPSSSFLSGAALESAIANMEEMGFAKPEIQRAMRASFNNPDRAIEYLMTGIPEGLGDAPAAGGAAPTSTTPASTTTSTTTTSSTPAVAPAAAAPAAAPAARTGNLFEAAAAAAQGGGAGGAGATGAAGGRGGIPGVEEDGQGGQTIDLGNPQMVEQLRTLLAQNPTALQPLIQAIAQSNPQLAQAMAQDPEGVLEMLAQGAEGGAAGEGEALPSFEELSEEDRTAVQNISAMGIPVDQAIECYLMCGRNVEMAVQYYFDNPGDFQ